MRLMLFAIALLVMIEGAWGLRPMRPATDFSLNGDKPMQAAVIDDVRYRLSVEPLRSNLWITFSWIRPGLAATDDLALEMAYLTGGEKEEDIPARLRCAVQSPAFDRATIRDFILTDLAVIKNTPRLRRALGEIAKVALKSNMVVLTDLMKTTNTGPYDYNETAP